MGSSLRLTHRRKKAKTVQFGPVDLPLSHQIRKEKTVKKILICLLLIALSPLQAVWAAADAKRALAEEMLTLSEARKNSEEILARLRQQIQEMTARQVAAMEGSPEEKQNALQIQDQMMAILVRELSWDNMKEEFIDLYLSVFTEEELRGIADFYRSDTGKKFTAKMPLLIEKSMQISQGHLQKALPEIQALVEKKAEAMR